MGSVDLQAPPEVGEHGMKNLLGCILLVVGCASQSDMDRYYRSIDKINKYRTDALELQVKENALSKTNTMVAFSKAMESAARTSDPSDNAVIALAWGFHMASDPGIVVPSLQYPVPPVTDVDRIKAAVPLVGYIFPFLSAWVWSSTDGDRSNTESVSYNLTGDRPTVQLNTNSRNSGSYNTGRDGMSVESFEDNSVDTLINSMASSCGDGGDGAGTQECAQLNVAVEIPGGPSIQPVGDPTVISDLEQCLATPPAGYSGGGTPMWGAGCSCESHFSGGC